MSLCDTAVRHAKATGKEYTLADTLGLSLRISRLGVKCWHFRYQWFTTTQRMSLGTYPKVTLLEARTLRDEARALVAMKVNPQVRRRQDRAAAQLAHQHSFKAVYQAWYAHRELSLKKGHKTTLAILPGIFDKDVLPLLGSRSIYDIKRSDLLQVIARIERRQALSVAEKVRSWLNQLFRYALVVTPGLEHNPATDLDVVKVPLPPVRHNPFLRMAELPQLLQRLRSYSGRLQTQLGIRLLLLTGVRTGELRLATPDQFDLDRGLWIIPPDIVKQLQTAMRKRRQRPEDNSAALLSRRLASDRSLPSFMFRGLEQRSHSTGVQHLTHVTVYLPERTALVLSQCTDFHATANDADEFKVWLSKSKLAPAITQFDMSRAGLS